jgi:hypothetical protein
LPSAEATLDCRDNALSSWAAASASSSLFGDPDQRLGEAQLGALPSRSR